MKLAILIVYALVLLVIGIVSALRIKSPLDYLLAGKRNGALQISGSLLATILGGSAILGTINLCEKQSWAASWYILAISIGLAGLLPIVRKVHQQGKFTLPGLMGNFYGETARKVTSLIIPVAWLGIIAAQIIASGQILVSFFAVSYETGVVLSGVIFIVYTYVGGQISVLKTDFFQSIVILLGVVITAWLLPSEGSGQMPVFAKAFPFNPQFSPVDLLILMLTFSTTFVVGPDIYSRVFCARDERVARQSVWIVLLVLIPLALLLAYIGVFAYAHQVSGEKGAALVDLINHYLPDWAAGLMVAALLSAVLSSASTTLLTASMILSELFSKDLNNQSAFRLTKGLLVLVGLLSMLISLKITSIVSSLLLALSFYSGAFIVPMAAALFKLPYNRRLGIPAMLTGGVLALTGKLMLTLANLSSGNFVIALGFLLNAILIFIPETTSNMERVVEQKK